MLRRLVLHLVPAAALSLLNPPAIVAQVQASSPDRWQLTLNDQSYLWNVRLVRLSGDTLTVRSPDSLIAAPIQEITAIQLLGETILRVGDGHRSGIGALGDNTSPIIDLAPLALIARRRAIQALLDYEATHR
jgi:hypothetical protein